MFYYMTWDMLYSKDVLLNEALDAIFYNAVCATRWDISYAIIQCISGYI